MINENFIYFGVLLNSVGMISYIIDTIKGKVKPNRVTFFLWALAPMIAFASEITQGVGLQSLLTFSVGFWPMLTLIASFLNKKSYWKTTKFDLACGVLFMVGLILWLVTKIGNIAIVFSIFADLFAALPTIKKSYDYPETETIWPYFSAVLMTIITILTIKKWDFPHYAFPVYILIINIILTTLIRFDFKKFLKKLG